MIMYKDDRQLDVTDRTHIDCLKSKGWRKLDKPIKSANSAQNNKRKANSK